jgi:hypothetical protein
MSDISFDSSEPTLGDKRVRRDFNVSPHAHDLVATIKERTAALIDLCERLKVKDGRLAALAQTAYEEAAMWAVKAATTPEE